MIKKNWREAKEKGNTFQLIQLQRKSITNKQLIGVEYKLITTLTLIPSSNSKEGVWVLFNSISTYVGSHSMPKD